jgi:hypothetical protein
MKIRSAVSWLLDSEDQIELIKDPSDLSLHMPIKRLGK